MTVWQQQTKGFIHPSLKSPIFQLRKKNAFLTEPRSDFCCHCPSSPQDRPLVTHPILATTSSPKTRAAQCFLFPSLLSHKIRRIKGRGREIKYWGEARKNRGQKVLWGPRGPRGPRRLRPKAWPPPTQREGDSAPAHHDSKCPPVRYSVFPVETF